MNLFKLQNLDTGWGEVEEMIVCAEDKEQARLIAAQNAGKEGADVWLHAKDSDREPQRGWAHS